MISFGILAVDVKLIQVYEGLFAGLSDQGVPVHLFRNSTGGEGALGSNGL